jgi:peptide deformylase
VRQIAQLGAPVLRERAARVGNLETPEIRALIGDLLATVADANGAGLAAPQVYESQRIFLLTPRCHPRYVGAPEAKAPRVVINPEVVWCSPDREKGWEGCLSIPGLRGLVPRNVKIRARYLALDGAVQEEDLEGFEARVFQHEYDHLDGIVYLDRLETVRDLVTEKEYAKLIG